DSIVAEAMIDAGTFRLQSIINDLVNIIIVNVGIEVQFGILQRAGRAGVNAIEKAVNIVIMHERADMPTNDDSRALHETPFDGCPRPFARTWIIYFILLNTRIIALIRSAVPIDENPQLHVVNLIL